MSKCRRCREEHNGKGSYCGECMLRINRWVYHGYWLNDTGHKRSKNTITTRAK